jgi:hypothetical protein
MIPPVGFHYKTAGAAFQGQAGREGFPGILRFDSLSGIDYNFSLTN